MLPRITFPVGLALALITTPLAAREVVLLRGEERTPYPGIQAALDQARPGDIVELADGVYHENPVFPRGGEAGRPITLRGKEGARPVIDGADPELQAPNQRWTPVEHQGRTFYTAQVPFRGRNLGQAIGTWVSYHGKPGRHGCDALVAAYASLDGLAEGMRFEGSFRKGETVTVNLQDGRNPNEVPLNIGRANAVLDLGLNSHLRVTNLELRNAGWSAIVAGEGSQELQGMAELDDAPAESRVACEDIEVSNLIIRNSFRGVSIGSAALRGLRLHRLVIANGTRPDWLWSAGYKSGVGQAEGNNSDGLAPVRGFAVRLVNVREGEVSECLVSGQWDGFGLKKCDGVRLHHNTLRDLMDDGVELESSDQKNIQFHNNHLYNVFAGLSVTSNFPGPMYLYRNVVEITHPGGRHFKPSYGVKSGHDSLGRAENVKFYHNTFYGSTLNIWEKIRDEAEDRWTGYDFVNNVFYSPKQNANFRGESPTATGAVNHWEGNVYSLDQPEEPAALHLPNLLEQFRGAVQENPDIPRDLRLAEGSPALNSAPDYPAAKGWPDSQAEFPGGRDRGAWEDGMAPDQIGAPAAVLGLLGGH
jgi:hypothetical protein